MKHAAALLATFLILGGCASPQGSAGQTALLPHSLLSRLGAANPKWSVKAYNVAAGALSIAGMANGSDGRIWFTEFNDSYIGAITTAGTVTRKAAATNSQPCAILPQPSGSAMWTGGFGGIIAKVTVPGFVRTDYSLANSHICSMVAAPGGNMWFADYGNNKVGKLATNGTVTEYAMPNGNRPIYLAIGGDGALWILSYNKSGENKIVHMNFKGKVLGTFGKFMPSPEEFQGITSAPDGNVYFTTSAATYNVNDYVFRLTKTGGISLIAKVPPSSVPDQLTVGKDRNVYFSFYFISAVGKITLSTQHVTLYPINLFYDKGTSAIVSGPDGRLWLGGGNTIYAVTY